jgi:hypothetical protein
MIAGFSIDRDYGLATYDAHCTDAGLMLVERWATWDREPFGDEAAYAVSVHAPAPG